jgi:hypothetical protein
VFFPVIFFKHIQAKLNEFKRNNIHTSVTQVERTAYRVCGKVAKKDNLFSSLDAFILPQRNMRNEIT